MTKQAITPAFAVSDCVASCPDWEIEACVADDDWKSFRETRAGIRPVKLVIYPELREYVIREYSAEKIRLCTAPLPKIPWFAIESDLRRKKWTLYFDPQDDDSPWFLFRMLLLYFSTLAQSRGHRFLHASGVSLNGEATLFCGPKGSSKSSLMYLACSRAGTRFMADGQVVLHFDGDCRLQAMGWPRRANLGLTLLGKESLSKSVQDTVLSEAGQGGETAAARASQLQA